VNLGLVWVPIGWAPCDAVMARKTGAASRLTDLITTMAFDKKAWMRAFTCGITGAGKRRMPRPGYFDKKTVVPPSICANT
jgi:hypothetical protein